MDFLKELFGENALTFAQFETAVKDKKINLADLSKGGYVDKSKYDADTALLQGQIDTHVKGLEGIRQKLTDAGVDENKLGALAEELKTTRQKYDDDIADYKSKLSAQAYEFAVKEFASEQSFTSAAAKRDFVRSMIEKQLKFEDGKIMGASDFLEAYKADNADCFVVGTSTVKPSFTAPTNPTGGTSITKEQFGKMGYKDRLELYNTNKELYDELSKE